MTRPRRGLVVALAVGGGVVTVGLVVVAILVAMQVTGVGQHRAAKQAGTPEVAVWLGDGLPPAQLAKIRTAAQTNPEVVSVSYVAPAKNGDLPAGLRPDSPTAVLLVRVKDADAAGGVGKTFSGLPGVRAVRVSA